MSLPLHHTLNMWYLIRWLLLLMSAHVNLIGNTSHYQYAGRHEVATVVDVGTREPEICNMASQMERKVDVRPQTSTGLQDSSCARKTPW
jgi:hypothetical protein